MKIIKHNKFIINVAYIVAIIYDQDNHILRIFTTEGDETPYMLKNITTDPLQSIVKFLTDDTNINLVLEI
jgi:hypothetical protein